MSVDLLLWALADATLEETLWFAEIMMEAGQTSDAEHETHIARLGAWRMTWWRIK